MKKKNRLSLLMYLFIPIVVVIVLDYFNLPSILGFKMSNVNYTLIDTVLNVSVVISLYIITFFLIDKRQIRKDDNAKGTADILMLSAYNQCKELSKIVDTQSWLESYIVPKVDSNKTGLDNRVILNLQNNPFAEHSHILLLAENGAISRGDLMKYFEIMELYKSFISLRITFYDMNDATTDKQKKFRSKIINDKNKLDELLDIEVSKLIRRIKEV
ncbi:hypothetical protein [Streptococcus parasanguinis]|jgi:hypothetical protein|uniref:hypothetical protein n=1 Tax=Streptococcus parasanguinis TaxID=1318 RepID=UPI00066E8882|nr:hypothetical protein [Streptococcus parasanguinis]MDK8142716.1 hypothetical protein [Streptococcus parasanguinis]